MTHKTRTYLVKTLAVGQLVPRELDQKVAQQLARGAISSEVFAINNSQIFALGLCETNVHELLETECAGRIIASDDDLVTCQQVAL